MKVFVLMFASGGVCLTPGDFWVHSVHKNLEDAQARCDELFYKVYDGPTLHDKSWFNNRIDVHRLSGTDRDNRMQNSGWLIIERELE